MHGAVSPNPTTCLYDVLPEAVCYSYVTCTVGLGNTVRLTAIIRWDIRVVFLMVSGMYEYIIVV